jgi:thiamine pyrophosphate-dependent acetolactate synthase large subunit-like protein
MGPRRRAWIDRGRQWCRRWKDSLDREAERASRSDPLDPAYAAHEIVRRAPRGTTFVSEGGACGMWLMASLWMHPLVFPVQQATIGTSIPMALGAAVGMRSARDADRPPVWCVLGDGAFFYHAAELAALSRHRVPAVLFVFNDSSWGAIRLGQTFACGGRYTGTDIPATDYAAVARACGCEALTAAGPRGLLEALERAAAARGPLLVDVKIRKDAVPFSGANFVLAEFDGVLKTSAPALAGGALLGALRRKVPAGVLRVMMSMMR